MSFRDYLCCKKCGCKIFYDANKDLAEYLETYFEGQGGSTCPNCVKKIESELAEARAEIVEIGIALAEKENNFLDVLSERDDLQRHLFKQNIRLAEARAEIERKDKLIEQMREALELILEGASYNFHYVCQHRDNCLCWGCQKARIKAALSAAERGER